MTWFAAINLVCAGTAAALWYVAPELGAWPLLLGIIPWLVRFERVGSWDWRTPFDWPILLFVLTGAISVWSAYDRPVAMAKLWMIVAAVLLFYAFVAFSLPGARSYGDDWAQVPAWLLAGFGSIVTLYFLMTPNWGDLPAKITAVEAVRSSLKGALPQLPGHVLHPNVVGGLLAMAVPYAAAVTWVSIRGREWAAALGAVLLGLTLFGLLMTTSRGAWLALAAGGGAALLWWLVGLISGGSPDRRRSYFSVILLVGGLLVLLALILRPDTAGRLISSFPALAGGAGRLDLYRNSLGLAQAYPFIGAGLGSFMMLYSTYAYLLHVGFLFHAHNLLLDVAIEQGLLGVGALLWMWVIFGAALWRRAGAAGIGPWLGAAAVSLVTILVHGLFEDAFYGSRALMLLFVPLAFALPYPQRAAALDRSSRAFIPLAAVGLALLIMVLISWKPIASTAAANLAAVRQSRAELTVYERSEWKIQDAVRRGIDMAPIVAGYEAALALNPDNASANRRLGQIELSLGAYEAALEHLGRAYGRTPWDNATRQMYGEALLLNGQTARGQSLLAGVNNAQKQLSARAYWYRTNGEAGVAAALEAVQSE